MENTLFVAVYGEEWYNIKVISKSVSAFSAVNFLVTQSRYNTKVKDIKQDI